MVQPRFKQSRLRLTAGFAARFAWCLAAWAVAVALAEAGVPTGYYDSVDASNPTALRSTLHDVIDDHTRFPYTASSTDTWDILESAMQDPNNAGRIIDIYRNASFAKQGGGNSFYDREHSWPKSYGFPDDGPDNLPYTDCHLLFLCDGSYNAARSNKPYRQCVSSCAQFATDANDGHGGQGGGYPGDSNWTSGSFTQGAWETWMGRRGDVARAMFYADLRYEGGMHTILNVSEPDLRLTDNLSLIDNSNTGSNLSVAYMGLLQDLLLWHQQDPPDAREMSRNDVVYAFQGNRNPFVDHPEWVACLFQGSCVGDTTPPAAPAALVATGGNGVVTLDWLDNGEPDLAGYRVYRSTGGAFTEITVGLVAVSAYADSAVTNGVTYTYQVTAEDVVGNESSPSASDAATPQAGGGTGVAWINEFHYDNSSTDVGEFVEIAGSAGTDLSSWAVVGYNGGGNGVYNTIPLSGVIPNQQNGFGTRSFAFPGMQNGAPDGLALVDGVGGLVEFLSYEGTINAIDGPAQGQLSTDVGVEESGSTPVGWSLQRVGSGNAAIDFVWQAPQPDSPGVINVGQTFTLGGDTTPPAAPTGLAVTVVGASTVSLDWADNSEGDLAGYDVYRATLSGGPYGKLTGTSIASSQYTDGTVVAGMTYYYVVTASDNSGNESGDSSEVTASPQLCQVDLGFANHPSGVLAVCGGDLSTGHDSQLMLSGIPVGAQILLFAGLSSNPVNVPELNGGALVPIPVLFLVSLPNFGTGALNLTVPGGGGPFSIYLQAVLAGPPANGVTNALRVGFLP